MSTQQRVLRYRIEVQDKPVVLPAGKVLLVVKERQDIFSTFGHLEVWIQAETLVGWPDVRTQGTTGAVGTQELLIVGTGHLVPDGAEHVGSTVDGPFVWHVYRMPAPEVKS